MSDFEIRLKSFVELADVANEKVTLKPFLLWEGIWLLYFFVFVGVPFQEQTLSGGCSFQRL